MKKVLLFLISAVLLSGCQRSDPKPQIELQEQEMRAICNLAVMKCYYHNVASYYEKDAEGVLFWKKDKHFWIEYDGIVELGIDGTQLTMDVDGENVTITLPEAKVLTAPTVDSASLTADSYYVDSTSAPITQEDETTAFQMAQEALQEKAEKDSATLAQAEAHVKTVLQNYVKRVGEQLGKDYKLSFQSSANGISETAQTTTAESETNTGA